MISKRINENNVETNNVHLIYKKISQNKGVTLVALIMTIVLLLILSSVAINNLNKSSNVAPYNNMIADIELLTDKIVIYYNKYGELPIIENNSQIIDDIEYYKIDLNKLENITLNYGTEKDGNAKDIYLVNNNLEVYYLEGIEKSGKIEHKL